MMVNIFFKGDQILEQTPKTLISQNFGNEMLANWTNFQPLIFISVGLSQNATSPMPTIIFKTGPYMERKHWNKQQDQILKELVQDIGITNWTLVAARMSQQNVSNPRTGKQCRQRWFYHLNDNICKKPWSEKQEQIIFEKHNIYGNRWKQITKHLHNRTENDTKNHFYAQLRKGIRRMNKFIGLKKHAAHIRKIRPSILSAMCDEYKHGEIFPNDRSNKRFYRQKTNLYSLLIKFSQKQPTEEQCLHLLSEETLAHQIQCFLDNLIAQNEKYLKKKEEIKQNRQRKRSFSPQRNHQNLQIDISQYLNLEPPSPLSLGFKSQNFTPISQSDKISHSQISYQKKEQMEQEK